jgi:hypothetical protein
MKYYCHSCNNILKFANCGYPSDCIICAGCAKTITQNTAVYFESTGFDGNVANMKGYREINVSNIKSGDYVRYVHKHGSFGEGTFVSATYYILLELGAVNWVVHDIQNTRFFVKISDSDESAKQESKKLVDLQNFVEVNVSEIKIGQHIKYIQKGEDLSDEVRVISISETKIEVITAVNPVIKFGWFVGVSDTKFYAKQSDVKEKTEISAQKIAELEAKIELLEKEKADADAKLQTLTAAQDALDKANQLCVLKNKDLPQEILDIVDEYKLFDLISLFRAMYKFDTDIEHLNKFQKILTSIKSEDKVPVEHDIRIMTIIRSETKPTYLYHEIHLVEVYALMKKYFAANTVTIFPIDTTNPVVIRIKSQN